MNVNVPLGRLVASSTWRGTQLVSIISSDIDVLYADDMDLFDFHPSDEVGVLFLSEADMIADELLLRRRLVKSCRKTPTLRKVVLIQKTHLTTEKFKQFQKFAAIDLGLSVIPVNTLEETSKVLKQLVNCEGKKNANPFRVRPHMSITPEESVLKSLQSIPGLGSKKCIQAVHDFGSLKNIINSSQDSLNQKFGTSAGISAYKFLNNKS